MPSTIAPPTDFMCPITMELMVYPMATKHGQNYEREAIMGWLSQGHRECPLTRKPLALKDLIHNNYLVAEIQKWCEQHNVPVRNALDTNRTMDDNLKHIYGTSVVPFTAVTVAPGYEQISPKKKSKSVQSPSRPIRSPTKQRIVEALAPMLRPKSLLAFSFREVKA